MEFVELCEKEFLNYSKNSPYTSFYQMPEWAKVKKINGWDSYFLGLKDGDKIIAATLLLSKKIKMFKTMFYAPRGFLLDYNNLDLVEEFTLKVKEFIKSKDALFLKINPYVDYQERTVDGEIVENTEKKELFETLEKLGFKHNGFYVEQNKQKDLEPRWISVLDIDGQTMDELYGNMRSSTKWRLNNSKKNALRIIEAKYEDLDEFKNLMKHTAERRSFIDRPLSYYQNMFKILDEKNLVKVLLIEINFKELVELSKKSLKEVNFKIEKLKGDTRKEKQLKELYLEKERLENKIEELKEIIKADGEKKIISGGWYMLYGREIIYLFGASYKKYMKYNPQYMLQWEMINYAIDNEYEAFNFYGIDGNFNKESKGYGLFDFKRGFNARVHELIGEFDLVIDKPRYLLYVLCFKVYKVVKKLLIKIKR